MCDLITLGSQMSWVLYASTSLNQTQCYRQRQPLLDIHKSFKNATVRLKQADAWCMQEKSPGSWTLQTTVVLENSYKSKTGRKSPLLFAQTCALVILVAQQGWRASKRNCFDNSFKAIRFQYKSTWCPKYADSFMIKLVKEPVRAQTTMSTIHTWEYTN